MTKPHITISGSIKCENLPAHMYENICEIFKLENPMYEKLRRMGNDRALYAVKKHFMYYVINGDKTIDELGRGAEKFLKSYFAQENISHTFAHKTSKVPLQEHFKSDKLVLRDYQDGVLESFDDNVGVLRLDTGFGKTIIALKLVEKIQQKTLIVVPRAHLKDQFIREIEKYYGFKPYVISKDYTYKDTPITLATIQTLQSMKKKGELVKLKNKFGCVIADECHGYVTDKARAVFREFNAHYLYGMTATPERTDEQGPAIFFTFGSILVDKKLPTVKPVFQQHIPSSHILVKEYPDMIEDMVNDEIRNSEIAKIAKYESNNKRKVLILTKRVSHIEQIAKFLPEKGVIKVYADDKDKSELLKSLKENERDFKIIIGTASLLGTGLDIPSLDTLIIACDLKSSVLTKQGVGRITRLFKDKEHPKIIDIHDISNGILHRQFLARRKLYRENGWTEVYGV